MDNVHYNNLNYKTMTMILTFDLIILSYLLKKFYELIYSNICIILILNIVVLGSIILRANRASGKILKGLQGAAATTIIARGVFDAYRALNGDKSSSSNSENNNNKTGNGKNTDKNSSSNNSKTGNNSK